MKIANIGRNKAFLDVFLSACAYLVLKMMLIVLEQVLKEIN
jgi:hypothetical protein